MIKLPLAHWVTCALVACSLPLSVVSAEQLFRLRNNMVLRGSMAKIATLKDGFGAASAGETHLRPIWLIDDGLRRIYLHGKGMVAVDPVDVARWKGTWSFGSPSH